MSASYFHLKSLIVSKAEISGLLGRKKKERTSLKVERLVHLEVKTLQTNGLLRHPKMSWKRLEVHRDSFSWREFSSQVWREKISFPELDKSIYNFIVTSHRAFKLRIFQFSSKLHLVRKVEFIWDFFVNTRTRMLLDYYLFCSSLCRLQSKFIILSDFCFVLKLHLFCAFS